MKYHLAFLALAFASQDCGAHQDRVLEIGPNGRIEGLPPEYSPSFVRIAFSPKGEHTYPIRSMEVSIGGKATTVPSCITYILGSRDLKDVTALASWYHEEQYIPYYFALYFHDPGYKEDSWPRQGFQLLFNLRTAKLMSASAVLVRQYGLYEQALDLDLRDLCKPAELKDVYVPRK